MVFEKRTNAYGVKRSVKLKAYVYVHVVKKRTNTYGEEKGQEL